MRAVRPAVKIGPASAEKRNLGYLPSENEFDSLRPPQ